MVNTLSAAELAARVQGQGLRLETTVAKAFLVAWERQGIVEQQDGGWRLTDRGEDLFSGWAVDEARPGT